MRNCNLIRSTRNHIFSPIISYRKPQIVESTRNTEKKNIDNKLSFIKEEITFDQNESNDVGLLNIKSLQKTPKFKPPLSNKYIYTEKKHQFNRRILSETLFSTSGCDVTDFMDYSRETKVRDINVVVIPPCILNMLKARMIKKDVIREFDYKVIAAALVGAASYLSKSEKITISPFAVRALIFGMVTPEMKPGDITAIVSGISKKEVVPMNYETENESFTSKSKLNVNRLRNDMESFILKHAEKEIFIKKSFIR